MDATAGRLLCGIDEAGLGPLLGPLTLGYSVLRTRGESDLWDLLARRVSREPRCDADHLIVADSKKVFTRNRRGRRRLEATALSFLTLCAAERGLPRPARELLFGALRPESDTLHRHPWYELLGDLPRELEPARVEISAALLEREMRVQGTELVDAGVRIVPAGELNESWDQTQSKAQTLWTKTLEILRLLWRSYGREAPEVSVDLQGGRTHYGPLLARAFPDASVRLIRRHERFSEYGLEERGAFLRDDAARSMRVSFSAKGEESSFAVALASCLAKYARETVMEAFNAYFRARQPDLRPTAGYTTDGRRWLEEARAAVEQAGIAESVLIRTR